MQKRSLTKPDGRALWLYSRRPIPAGLPAPSPSPGPVPRGSHLRWHPLRGEWIAYATHRQARTFLAKLEGGDRPLDAAGAPPVVEHAEVSPSRAS